MAETCIFCAIAKKQIPAEILFEDEQFLAFRDIRPMAPVHILIIPKTHFDSLDQVPTEQSHLMGALLLCAQSIARQQNLAPKGYRIMINTGAEGGQTVPHLHLHLLGGKLHLPVQVG